MSSRACCIINLCLGRCSEKRKHLNVRAEDILQSGRRLCVYWFYCYFSYISARPMKCVMISKKTECERCPGCPFVVLGIEYENFNFLLVFPLCCWLLSFVCLHLNKLLLSIIFMVTKTWVFLLLWGKGQQFRAILSLFYVKYFSDTLFKGCRQWIGPSTWCKHKAVECRASAQEPGKKMMRIRASNN